MKEVAIIMGSDSDLEIMSEAANVLDQLRVEYELTVVSAHRTPERMYEFAKNARSQNYKVIIAGAGGSAHLPGMVASLTTLPVIGVPIKTKSMNGLDSLLSIVQMPGGIPVATVAVNGAKNAGLLAVSILAISNNDLQNKLTEYKNEIKDEVLKKAEQLEKEGFEKYLQNNK